MLERGGAAPCSLNVLHYKRGSVTLIPMPLLRCVATVVAHEKHRPSGVRTRRRQSPLLSMFSKFCPCSASYQQVCSDSPLRGAVARGGILIITINLFIIFILFLFYLLYILYCCLQYIGHIVRNVVCIASYYIIFVLMQHFPEMSYSLVKVR